MRRMIFVAKCRIYRTLWAYSIPFLAETRFVDPHWINAVPDPDPEFGSGYIFGSGSGSRVLILKNLQLEKFFIFFDKNFTLPGPRPSKRTHKLQEKPSALKREHSARQNMKLFTFFYICESFLLSGIWIRIQNSDPDPASQINADPDPDPNPKPWLRLVRTPQISDCLVDWLIDSVAVGRNLASQLLKMKLVSGKEPLEFCSCNDEKEQFREARRQSQACGSSFKFKGTGLQDWFDF